MKILLAEDDARLRKNILYILRKEFHHVIEVDNGLDALDNTYQELVSPCKWSQSFNILP